MFIQRCLWVAFKAIKYPHKLKINYKQPQSISLLTILQPPINFISPHSLLTSYVNFAPPQKKSAPLSASSSLAARTQRATPAQGYQSRTLNTGLHSEACWKCRLSRSISDLMDENVHFNEISRWCPSLLRSERHCFRPGGLRRWSQAQEQQHLGIVRMANSWASPCELNPLGLEPSNPCFNKPSRWLWPTRTWLRTAAFNEWLTNLCCERPESREALWAMCTVAAARTEFHSCSLKAGTDIMWTNELGRVPIKRYLWTLDFEFHITFMGHETFFFWFFFITVDIGSQSLKNTKPFLANRPYKDKWWVKLACRT